MPGVRRNRRVRKTIRAQRGTVMITSMMDILTTLLFFLLKSFVSDAGPSTPPPGVMLPNSTTEGQVENSIVIAVSHEAILLGEKPIVKVSDALARDGIYLQELGGSLDGAWTQMEELAKRSGREDKLTAKVTIQGDRDMEFRVLQKVMYTCNQRGFDEISLAVVQGS
jgi:biopolymer transport protein ExbD